LTLCSSPLTIQNQFADGRFIKKLNYQAKSQLPAVALEISNLFVNVLSNLNEKTL